MREQIVAKVTAILHSNVNGLGLWGEAYCPAFELVAWRSRTRGWIRDLVHLDVAADVTQNSHLILFRSGRVPGMPAAVLYDLRMSRLPRVS